jgi:hypothetical protein
MGLFFRNRLWFFETLYLPEGSGAAIRKEAG